MTKINWEYNICPSYSSYNVTAAVVSDKVIEGSAQVRAGGRFPVLVWTNGADGNLFYAGQPLPNYPRLGTADSEAITKILSVCKRQNKIHIIDTGSHTDFHMKHIPLCKFHYLSLEGDATGRDETSLKPTPELSKRWLDYIAGILRGGQIVSQLTSRGLTSVVQGHGDHSGSLQVMSLALLLLDPYYRTVKGFCILVEKIWIAFSFEFNPPIFGVKQEEYRDSPAFVQFIDAVYQISIQYPQAFEFNEELLNFTLGASTSGIFGTFLFSSESSRQEASKNNEKGFSAWSYVLLNIDQYLNSDYDSTFTKEIQPNNNDVVLWKYYNKWNQDLAVLRANIINNISEAHQCKSDLFSLKSMSLFDIPEPVTKLSHLKFLNLSHNYFSTLPVKLGQFKSLTKLNVSHNKLNFLHEHFLSILSTHLTQLAILDLSWNRIFALPATIANFPALQSLKLEHNFLTKLPESINSMELLRLDFSHNQLTKFPNVQNPSLTELICDNNPFEKDYPSEFSFPNLEILSLAKCALSDLKSTFNLPVLTELNLSSNRLGSNSMKEGSAIDGKFLVAVSKTLKSLKLNENELTLIPKELTKLTCLTYLDLSNNHLATLHKDLSNLTSLKHLDISHNYFTKLPLEVWELPSLTDLNISHNKLTVLAPAIGKLTNLSKLDISANNLDTFPATIGTLPLKVFQFEENKLKQVPKAIASSGSSDLLGYLKDQMKGNQPCYRSRVLCFGCELSGKTTLCNLISKGKKKGKTGVKQGASVLKWPSFKIANNEGKVKHEVEVALYDFDGQSKLFFFDSKPTLFHSSSFNFFFFQIIHISHMIFSCSNDLFVCLSFPC